jgi:hypothetical protein
MGGGLQSEAVEPAYQDDTDPNMAAPPPSALVRANRRLGRHRRLFVPLGVLSVLVLGVHAAADRFADWAFVFIDAVGNLYESAYGRVADLILSNAEQRKQELAESFDRDAREDMARWVALAVELLLVVRLGIACLGAWRRDALDEFVLPGNRWYHRLWAVVMRPIHRLGVLLKQTGGYLAHVSIEKIYLPLAVAMAGLAGTLALFVALDNAFYALGRRLPEGLAAWQWLSPWPAAVACLIVAWRLGLPAVTGTLARCQIASERDRRNGDPFVRRTLRGVWGAVFVLPILVAGLWTGTPLGAWAARLWGGG